MKTVSLAATLLVLALTAPASAGAAFRSCGDLPLGGGPGWMGITSNMPCSEARATLRRWGRTIARRGAVPGARVGRFHCAIFREQGAGCRERPPRGRSRRAVYGDLVLD